ARLSESDIVEWQIVKRPRESHLQSGDSQNATHHSQSQGVPLRRHGLGGSDDLTPGLVANPVDCSAIRREIRLLLRLSMAMLRGSGTDSVMLVLRVLPMMSASDRRSC